MKPCFSLLPMSCYVYLHMLNLFTLILMCFGPNKTLTMELGNQTDHLALLQFKQIISSDPYGILDSWNSSTHFCKWHGITCSPKHQRVTKLKLQGYKLHGSISPSVGNLTHMRFLNLGDNDFNGNIPQELGRLSRLRYLLLPDNLLVGEFPLNLTKCYELKTVSLAGNKLIGKIPSQIGSLVKLMYFSLDENNFSGKIPSQIGSLVKLIYFSLEENNFSGKIPPSIRNLSSLIIFFVGDNTFEGNIPQEMCFLTQLQTIAIHVNKFVSTFHSCLYNISSLRVISISENEFSGSLPSNMFHTLPNLMEFEVGGNQFFGQIPTSIANASTLTWVDISKNYFVGQVPCLGKLQSLIYLNLESNNLGDSSTKDLAFLKSLANCSKLQMLSIAKNNFGGSLKNSIGSLSTTLSELYFGGNQMYGNIPIELGNLTRLILLSMENNYFEGKIPTVFGKFQIIQLLDLSVNRLSGEIPSFIGNLSQLYYLGLEVNILNGNIPPNLGNCQKLQYLNFSQNNLKGFIPLEILNISYLSNSLDLSRNSLTGSLPKEVGMLKNLGLIDVSENLLSGNIPGTIGECLGLEYLQLQGNSFNGTIPYSLSSLKGLKYLDLSRNQLSGPIPDVLQNISVLEHLNVSFNMLEGEVPKYGVFGNATKAAMIGNNKLCGGISQMHLPPCPITGRKHSKHNELKLIVVIVSLVSFLLILSFITIIFWMRRRNQNRSSDSPTIDQLTKVSYQALHRGTDGFSTTNLIGSGSFGSVYKGNLISEDSVVAVKVLNLQKKGAHKSFILECNALKNIRHRNLVNVLTCCSSTDYKGQEFKALVFDYMKNGNLEQWLHSEILNAEPPITLDLSHRLNIIIDVASALYYLHQECEQLIIHCDLKPSNILLDDDMVAHVGDFGIARLVSTIGGTSQKDTSTIGIKGTVGYAPPEYGMGSEVSKCGDMYSFGILILEMLTGKRPTDESFEDGENLHNFVATSFPENLIKILDPHLVSRDVELAMEDANHENLIPRAKECLVSLFRIGLICSMESPKERMSIMDVTRELNTIKKAFLAGVRTRN